MSGFQELLRRWNRVRYTNPTEPIPLAPLINSIDRAALPLTSEQQEELHRSLSNIFSYFESPSFNAYYRINSNDDNAHEVSIEPSLTGETVPVSGSAQRDMFFKYWTSFGPEKPRDKVPRLTSISLNSVSACLDNAGSVEALLNSKVKKAFSVVRTSRDAEFKKTNRNDAGSALFLCMSFYARSSSSTNAGPVFLNIRWEEESKKWMPGKLLIDEALNLSLPF